MHVEATPNDDLDRIPAAVHLLQFERAMLMHNIGRVVGEPGYVHYVLSSNYRISEFQAGLLLSQLERLPDWTERKQENGRWLGQQLRELGGLEPLKEDARITQRGHWYFVGIYDGEQFGALSRDKFVEALNAEGVPTNIGFGMPLYCNPAFEPDRLRQAVGPLVHLPVAERFCRKQQVIFPHMLLLAEREDLEMVVAAIAKVKRFAGEVRA